MTYAQTAAQGAGSPRIKCYACPLTTMPNLHKSVVAALRVAVAAACCVGIWSSLNFARADYLFQKDTDQSIRSAIHFVPDGWPYYMRLAQFDRANARQLLESSLRLNPYNAQADIELGLQYEADGNLGEAEKHLLNAYSIDRTYLPRWSLANYYFRHDNMPAFWTWARSAAAMPADDIGALLELCWRAAPNAQTITGEILERKARVSSPVPWLSHCQRPASRFSKCCAASGQSR